MFILIFSLASWTTNFSWQNSDTGWDVGPSLWSRDKTAKYDSEACHPSHLKKIQGYPISRQGYGDGLLGQSRSYNDKLSVKRFHSHRRILCQWTTWATWSIEEQATRKAETRSTSAAPAHTAGVATSVAAECGYELLPHPPYSPDLAPSDFYLFPLLKEHLRGSVIARVT